MVSEDVYRAPRLLVTYSEEDHSESCWCPQYHYYQEWDGYQDWEGDEWKPNKLSSAPTPDYERSKS